MATKKVYKLELFPLLRNISTKNVGYFDGLSEEQVKEFSPLLLQRWLSGCNDGQPHSARQIYFLNEFVNPYVFDLKHIHLHKKLIYNLMTLCTTGRDCRYTFNKSLSKRGSNMPKTTAVLKEVFGYNTSDSFDALSVLADETIIEMAEQLGYQKAEIKDLKKELKDKRT